LKRAVSIRAYEALKKGLLPGRERRSLEEEDVRRLGIEGKVHFAGKLDDMPGVYASLEILVPSSLKEGLPMTILETLAAGTPVVADAVGAVSSVMLGEQTGLLAPPADSAALAWQLLRLLNDHEHRDKVASEGRRFVEKRFPCAEAKLTEIYSSLGEGTIPAEQGREPSVGKIWLYHRAVAILGRHS
jgi:glycosyltransferase involved in cell wall biosynthesis